MLCFLAPEISMPSQTYLQIMLVFVDHLGFGYSLRKWNLMYRLEKCFMKLWNFLKIIDGVWKNFLKTFGYENWWVKRLFVECVNFQRKIERCLEDIPRIIWKIILQFNYLITKLITTCDTTLMVLKNLLILMAVELRTLLWRWFWTTMLQIVWISVAFKFHNVSFFHRIAVSTRGCGCFIILDGIIWYIVA